MSCDMCSTKAKNGDFCSCQINVNSAQPMSCNINAKKEFITRKKTATAAILSMVFGVLALFTSFLSLYSLFALIPAIISLALSSISKKTFGLRPEFARIGKILSLISIPLCTAMTAFCLLSLYFK